MLNEVEEVAHFKGWLCVNETATSGLVARLDEHVAHIVGSRAPRARSRVTGVTLPLRLGGVDTEPARELPPDVRRRLAALLEDLRRTSSGLLLTIDEVHGAGRSDLREIATITQHLIREDRQVTLVMAGLPSAVSSLLSDDVLTCLRRADKHVLTDVPVEEVRVALTTITTGGRAIDPDASDTAAEATGGFPS